MAETDCDKDVYEYGEMVFLTHTLSGDHIEDWVVKIREESNQQVDWHYFGGRAVIKALGDLEKVKQAIYNNKSLHDLYYREACEDMMFNDIKDTDRIIDGIWKYNGF